MDRLLSCTRLKKLVIGNIPEMSVFSDSIDRTAQHLQRVLDTPEDERHVTFASLIDNKGVFSPFSTGNPHEEIAVLQYTGGTTGLPKGAMLTHANLTAACSQIHTINGGDPRVLEEGRESVLAVLPMFHIYALSVNMLFAIHIGARIVLHTKFELEAVLKDLTEKKITVFPGVPTMFTAIVNSPDIDKSDLTSLRLCNSGGAPLPMEVSRRFQHLTGSRVVEGWGMTETSATGTFTPQSGVRKTGSCGIPVAGVTLKFVDVDDPTREVARGERGELCIKGPNVMRGYWKKSEATAASMTPDGFFRTGDVAWMDEDGFVYIVDRTKDMILCGGFNVYPRIIEEAIYEHSAVAEVSVIGVPDAYRGESPKAFIVLKPDTNALSLEELQTFLKGRLGKHEMVQMLEIRTQLPKTPVGKLSKKELYDDEERKRQAN
jgi:long-chain acyl-CoA synthetase